jgi:uncharacterized protein
MIVTSEIKVNGMHCFGCESIIEDAISKIDGILYVKANFQKSFVKVSFYSDKTSLIKIQEVCESYGYSLILIPGTKKHRTIKILLSLIALAGLALLIIISRKLGHKIVLPEVNSDLTNGMIFLVGLLTGLHCVGMCGTFIIGYTSADTTEGRSRFRSHILYGAGKTLSYALLGALFGFAGSLFRITPLISGISICIAGVFLIFYGLNMLNIFPVLKPIRIKHPKEIAGDVQEKRSQSKSPFFIGSFSGFILGCGPLQVMYVMAAGNGNAVEGAKFLTLFGLGTLPALFAFGLLARALSNRMTRNFIHASGMILIVLGSMMLNKGLLTAKADDDLKSIQPACQCQKMTGQNSGKEVK